MPKATKKKKAKEADFKKAKLKLGKGKKPANNATDTSFKARSIALPGQNPLNRALASQAGSSTEATTSSGLNLEDVFIRFRHPNAGVRKEAIGGLKEILAVKAEREVGKVLKALGGLIADEDTAVRKALLGFLGWYFPQLPIRTLEPHLPLFLLQTSSALSHIFPETRLDAAKLVNLLLLHIPDFVVGSWPSSGVKEASENGSTGGSTILEGLRLALGLGDAASASRLTAGGKLIVLKALLGFLKAALGEQSAEGEGRPTFSETLFDGWDADSRRTAEGSIAVAVEIKGNSSWDAGQPEGWVIGQSAWALETTADPSWEVSRIGGVLGMEQEESQTLALVQMFDQLKTLLLNTFLEAAPSAFSISSTIATPAEDVSLQLCCVSASLVECLARHTIPSENSPHGVRTGVSDFLKRMAAWFPFSLSSSASATALSPSLSLSISYANLACLLSSNPIPLEYPRGLRREIGWRDRVKATEAAWAKMRNTASQVKVKGKGRAKGGSDVFALESVAEWILELLSPPQDAFSQPLSPHTYAAIMPLIFAMITQSPSSSPTDDNDDIPTSVLSAFLQHLARQSSTSATRSIGDAFLMRLVRIHEQRLPRLPFFVPLNSPGRALIQAWLESLPKVLWEIGTRDSEAAERILRFLLWIGLRGARSFERPYSLVDPSAFGSIATKFGPYFHLTHPSRGDVPGPWTRLDSKPLRRLALDVARVWVEWDDNSALREAVGKAVAEDALWSSIWRAAM